MNEGKKCSRCGKSQTEDDSFIVDGNPVCAGCLFNDHEPFHIYPIGFVHNDQERDHSDFGIKNRSGLSRIVLFESQKPFLYKLEDEEYITVVFYLHKSRPVRSTFKRGLDGKKVGVFASRTPDRLNHLAITYVRLLKIEGTSLFVEGLDAINGTPVVDIKMKWK